VTFEYGDLAGKRNQVIADRDAQLIGAEAMQLHLIM
jgi:hypothetical protein